MNKAKLLLWFFLLLITFHLYAQNDDADVLDINLRNYDYPFPVGEIKLKFEFETLQMAYMDVKPENPNGKSIMLLHGKNFNGAYWEETAKVLAENGYRVIIPDQIGFGKSSKPQHLQYSFHQLAENTKKILDSLEIEKITVLGHSMGGMLAVRFTLMYPDLVEKLVLANPIGLEDYKLKVPYKPVDWWYRNELKQNYASIKEYQQKNYYHGEWKPEYEKWTEVPAGWIKNLSYPVIAWNSALTYDMIFTQPVCYELEKISSPTLLIIGQSDRTAIGKNLVGEEVSQTMGNYPELGRETKNKIPDCELIEIEGVGHLPHIEAFDEFIEPLLNFLNKN